MADETSINTPNEPPKPARTFHIPSAWKLAVLLLVIALAWCIFMWKPWQANVKASDRTISVTGSTTITAEPDEYIFTPRYDFKGSDPKAAVADLTKKSNDLVAKLKSLGVADSKIKTNASDYKDYTFFPESDGSNAGTFNLMLTITSDDKTQAQKIQDYLVTTIPVGSITPEATFSAAKEKSLESQARDKAEKDARAKADQSAKNLGFKVKAVKSVEDGSLASPGCYARLCAGADVKAATPSSSLNLQPGENDLPYSVTIVYYIN